MAIDWQSKGIDLSRFSGRTSGHVKVHCPQCHDRRKNKADKSLSCDLATGAYRCHYCGWHGYATVTSDEEKEAWMQQQPWYRDYSKRKAQTPKQEYARPPQPRTTVTTGVPDTQSHSINTCELQKGKCRRLTTTSLANKRLHQQQDNLTPSTPGRGP